MPARLFPARAAHRKMPGVVRPTSSPLALRLHGDLLDPWCWLAERRITVAAEGLPGRFSQLEHAPLPLRWESRVPSAVERRRRAAELRRAAREPDAPRFTPELWTVGPGPHGSAPALVAVAAAALQGPAAASTLRAALRDAALVCGLDVSRRDIQVELAARAGLDLGRFLAALDSPATERALWGEIEAAREAGIETGPALVIADDWLVPRLRSLRDYRLVLRRYLVERAGTPTAHGVH